MTADPSSDTCLRGKAFTCGKAFTGAGDRWLQDDLRAPSAPNAAMVVSAAEEAGP